ncbi:hypothetical protein ACIQPQ_33645 [Streptomyces sp. NPDC091281]|uniref:hypothetical protein n=1 Tax=Streptomyces sp. NPDC091281 TaxID=3365985 RepID=UPI00381AE625
MTEPNDAHVAVDYKCRFEFQAGWVDLTLAEATRSAAVALATEWANSLNPLHLDIEKKQIINSMVDRALRLSEDEPVMAAAYYSENGIGLAEFRLDSYGEEDVARPTPAEVQPQLLGWSFAEVAGEPDTEYLDLVAGPAVRVRAVIKTRRLLGLGRRLHQSVKYAVFPPGFHTLAVVTVTWQAMDQTDFLTQLVDELLESLRIVLVDADGNEISPSTSQK